MIFDSYPMDTHICYFTLGSFKYDASYLNFSLGGLNFDNDKQVSTLDYAPQVKPLSEVQQKSFYNEHSHYWSRTGFDIILKRNFKKYFIDFYVPSGILVTISWVSKMTGYLIYFWAHTPDYTPKTFHCCICFQASYSIFS